MEVLRNLVGYRISNVPDTDLDEEELEEDAVQGRSVDDNVAAALERTIQETDARENDLQQLILFNGPSVLPTSALQLSTDTSSTLLPTSIAQCISAASIAARISLRASALFLEAILESAQCTTDTGMGITRRALIAAVQSARRLQDQDAVEDSYMRILDKYTNAGVYLIHNAFSLAELFAMSGFYLTRSVISGGFSAAEESVRLFDDLFGNTEASRALASIISLVRRELIQDVHFSPSQSRYGHLATLSSLTKALTAFACLQNATHRRSLASFKLKVVYDCTVVNRSSETSSSVEGSDENSKDQQADEEVVDKHVRYSTGPNKRRSVASIDDGEPLMDLRQAKENGHTWKDDVHLEGQQTPCKRHKGALALQQYEAASPMSVVPSDSDDEDFAFQLEQIVGGDDNETGRGPTRREIDPQILQQIHEALANVHQEMRHGDSYDIQIETQHTTETTTFTATAGSPASPISRVTSIDEWVRVPQEESVAEYSMIDSEKNPEHGKKQLGIIVKTLTRKMTERKQSVKKIIRKPKASKRSGFRSPTPHSNSDSDYAASGSSTPKQFISRIFNPAKRSFPSTQGSIDSTAASSKYATAAATPMASSPIQDSGFRLDMSDSEPADDLPRAIHEQIPTSSSVHTMRTEIGTYTETYGEEDNPIHECTFPDLPLVESLQRFCKYSSAAYGQHFLRILGIGNVDYTFPNTGTHHGNVHAFAHHVGLKIEDVLLSSFTPHRSSPLNNSKAPPIVHYIAVDHHAKAIVLTLRGTLGLGDLLVDLTADYESLSVDGGDPMAAYYAHKGMLNSARQLKAERGIVHDTLKSALQDNPQYGLIVTGHSLGGGVAALLSMLWACPADRFASQRRPLHCFAYGIPCVASPDLAEWSQGLVTSLVHHLDVVPTLSLGTLRDLKQVAAALWEDDGKIAEEVVGRVIGLYHRRSKRAVKDSHEEKKDQPAALMDTELASSTMTAKQWHSGRKNHVEDPDYQDPALTQRPSSDDEELDDWLWSLLKTLRATADTDKLYPPGHVYVIESHEVFVHEEADGKAQNTRHSRREGRRVILRYSQDVAVRFSEPIFSRSMFLDHSPSAYESSINTLAQAVLP